LKFLVPFGALAALGALVPRTAPATAPPAALAALSRPFVASSATAFVAAAPRAGMAWLPILGTIWLLGSVLLAARWLRAWLRLWRLARTVNCGGVNASFEPGVFGIFRPVLLLPAALEQRLSAEQLEAVLAHERCHLRRRDNLWSALHRLVEVGFWFHPFVWWIGARMVAERERACDEAVLAEGRDPAVYARAMIERKLGARLTPLRALRLAVLAVAAVAAPVAAGMAWAQAATQSSKLGSFDAFTIKPAAPLGPGRMMFRFDPTRVTIEGATFGTLIERAFDLQPFLFVFPDSLSKQRWDITAVTSAP